MMKTVRKFRWKNYAKDDVKVYWKCPECKLVYVSTVSMGCCDCEDCAAPCYVHSVSVKTRVKHSRKV